jgi:hypothetical protein
MRGGAGRNSRRRRIRRTAVPAAFGLLRGSGPRGWPSDGTERRTAPGPWAAPPPGRRRQGFEQGDEMGDHRSATCRCKVALDRASSSIARRAASYFSMASGIRTFKA